MLFRTCLKNNSSYTVIFGGDFNVGDISWDSKTVHEHSKQIHHRKKKMMYRLDL